MVMEEVHKEKVEDMDLLFVFLEIYGCTSYKLAYLRVCNINSPPK